MTNLVDITLDEAKRLLTPEQYNELEAGIRYQHGRALFFPNPGPQYDAAVNTADVTGYGGAAGGGKSYLVAGLAVSAHKRSAIVRPQKNQTKKFVQEIAKILETRDGYSSQSSSWTFTTPDGVERYVEFFGLDNPGDEEKQQGVDFDLKAYDEVTQMREDDVRYTLTWNRTDDKAQRVRALLTFNPPTTPEGRWVIRYFAPWLDPLHPRPAKEGELRYFATIGDNKDYEVAGPQRFIIKTLPDGKQIPWYGFNPANYDPVEIITPESRTFIRAKVTDNPYYMATGYIQKLQALPEPLRSQMLRGDFMAGIKDSERQVIPTSWIVMAQERWKELQPRHDKGPLDSIGVDAARGGNMGGDEVSNTNDEMVIALRHGTYYDELKVFDRGVDMNDGAKAAGLIVGHRKDDAPVHIDVVGIGTSPFDFLRANNIYTIPVNGAASPTGMDRTGQLRFANMRAQLHWRMREALDPQSPDPPIALPPDPQLLVDLAAPTWSLKPSGIAIEPKDDIKKRIGRSPDRGEAVMLANMATPKRAMMVGAYILPAGAPPVHGEDYETRRMRELTDG